MLKLGTLNVFLAMNSDKFEQRMAKAKKDFHGFGQQLKAGAMLAGAAIGAALGAGLVGAMDVTKAKARLDAQLGNTKWAGELGAIAGNVYARGFGESSQAVNDSMRAIMTSGLLSEDAAAADIEKITVKAQAMADVFGLEVTPLARAAGQMIRNGLVKDASEAFDLITRAQQETGDHAGDLLDTYSEYSTKFRDLGLSGAESMGLMTQALKAGARDTDTAADALKEFAIRAIDGSTLSAQGYKMLGLNAEKMTAQMARGGEGAKQGLDTVLDRLRAIKDPVAQDAAAVALFGTKAEDLGNALLAMDVDKAADGLGNVAGASTRLGETLEKSASQKVEAFKRSVQSAFVEKLGQAIPYVEKMVGWADKHKAIVGPLVTILGTFAAIIGVITVATKIWTITQAALNVMMMLNPIGLIVLAIILLVAGIYLLWTKSEGFRKFFIGMWDWIWGVLKAFGSWIVDTAGPALLDGLTWPFRKAWEFISWVWSMITTGAQMAHDWIIGKITALVGFFTSLPSRISTAISGLWDGLKSSFRAAINWLIQKWNDFHLTLGGGSVLGMNIPSVTLNTPNIPMLDRGGTIAQAGEVIVGERRPERLFLPRGARVEPLDHRGNGGGETSLTVTFDGRGVMKGIRKTVRIKGGRPNTLNLSTV